MTQDPNPSPDPDLNESSASSSRPSRLLRAGVVVSGAVLLTGIAGVVAAQYFVYNRLVPLVENSLSDTLNRPVELGDVQSFNLFGIQVDGATIPPTEDSRDYVLAERVNVGLRPWHLVSSLVRDRQIPITLTLINPQVYAYQDEDGEWLRLELDPPDETEPPFTIVVDQVQVDDATLIMAAYPQLLEPPRSNPNFSDDLERLEAAIRQANAGEEPATLEPEQLPEAASTIISADEEEVALQAPLIIENIDVEATLREENRYVSFELTANPRGGGRLAGDGEADIEERQVNALVRTTDLQVAQVSPILPIPGRITSGSLDSNLQIRYAGSGLPSINGTARLRDGSAQLTVAPQAIADVDSQLRFDGQEVFIEDTTLNYGGIEVAAEGAIDLETGYALTAQVLPTSLETIQDAVNLELPFLTSGQFVADAEITGPLDSPVVQGTLRNVGTVQVDRVDFETVFARFDLAAPILNVSELTLLPAQGGRIAGSGQVNLEADGGVFFDIQVVDLPGDEFASTYNVNVPTDYRLGQVNADVEVFGPFDNIQAVADWRLVNSSFPGQGNIRYDGNLVRLQDTRLSVEGGTLTADATANLAQNTWQAQISTRNVDIGRFSEQLQGLLNADLRASGRLDNFNPQAIALQGEARLADARIQAAPGAEPLIPPGDWLATFRWTGQGIQLDRFTAPGIDAGGFIAVNLDGAPSLGAIALNVDAREFNLSNLAAFLPAQVQEFARLRGVAAFTGQVAGTATNPSLVGDLRIRDLAVNAIEFDSTLAGDIQFSLAQGGAIDLAGGGDRLAVAVDDRLIPTRFTIQNVDPADSTLEFLVEGETRNDILSAQVRDFRLSQLQYNPLPAQNLGIVRGVLNANIEADLSDLSNPDVLARVAIAQGGVGTILADSFRGSIRYQNGLVALSDGELQFGDSEYLLAAQADLNDPNLAYQANLNVVEGRVQDILALLDWSDLSDLQRGLGAPLYEGEAILTTAPAALPNASLLTQLDYFIEFVAEQRLRMLQEETAVVPDLDELEGSFVGEIDLSGSRQAGFAANFDIIGANWAWGQYDAPNSFVLEGSATEDTVVLEPFRFESEGTLVAVEGSIGLVQQDAQLLVQGVPLGLIQDFVDLPVDLEGDLYARATLGGNLRNPVAQGVLEVEQPVVNGTPLRQTAVEFAYADARLNFDGAAVIENENERLTLVGSVPYALPFMTVQPESDRLLVDIDLRNEGLAFLGLVTRGQATWEGGAGDVDVRVTGTLAQPLIEGTASFVNGAIASPLLEDPITGITGITTFDLNRATVRNLVAEIDGGDVLIAGTIPIFDPPATPVDDPLSVTVDQLGLDLDDAIEATLNGDLVVTGAVLSPIIGGRIDVSNGRVNVNRLSNLSEDLAESPVAPAEGTTAEDDTAVDANEDDEDIDVGVDEEIDIPDSLDAPIAGADLEDEEEEVDVLSPIALEQRLEIESEPSPGFLDQVQFNDLVISLSESLQIVGRPLYELEASGDVTLNGTASDIRPNGVIRLTDGWINIFATQFRVNRSEENIAVFTPASGLDPYLNVQLVARVREVERIPVAPSSDFASAEVADQTRIPTYGGLQTVEIFATVDGPASELTQSPGDIADSTLRLTSDPPRSDQQIVALIGGQTLQQLEGGALAGIASFVGSGFLSGIGNDIANALGLSTFSIFPTAGDVGGESRVPFAIGVEAGIEITDNLSFTVLEILDGNLDPQFGLQYRLSDNFRVRASTNLDDDTRAIFEYRNSF